MFKNNAKKIFDEAIERKKQAQKERTTMVLVNKEVLEKLKADLDYLAMMSEVELEDSEEVVENEQV
jgi:RecJ-like exonuclease